MPIGGSIRVPILAKRRAESATGSNGGLVGPASLSFTASATVDEQEPGLGRAGRVSYRSS